MLFRSLDPAQLRVVDHVPVVQGAIDEGADHPRFRAALRPEFVELQAAVADAAGGEDQVATDLAVAVAEALRMPRGGAGEQQTGGFDETYLIGCDIEMAIRLWRADVTLMWSPEALVHYRLRSTPRAVYRQARAYGRSRLRFDAPVPELEPTHGATKQLRRLAWLMRHLPDLRSLEGRFKWSWVSGQVVGEVEGLLRRQQP